jgi:hypothetical protein
LKPLGTEIKNKRGGLQEKFKEFENLANKILDENLINSRSKIKRI